MCVCVCVCVCEGMYTHAHARTREGTGTQAHTRTHQTEEGGVESACARQEREIAPSWTSLVLDRDIVVYVFSSSSSAQAWNASMSGNTRIVTAAGMDSM